MGAELFHGERRTDKQDRRTDKHDEGNGLFCNFANMTKKTIKRVALIMLIIALQFDVSTSKKKKRVALIMLIIALMN